MIDDPSYDVHSIGFLSNPALAGLTADFTGAGVIRATQEGTGARCTFIVEHDYAALSLAARRDLDGFIPLAITAVRWLRLGWPEDWADGALNPAWARVYPAGGAA
ncbi:hypothetical protein V3C33_13775 [Micrococcaceae bacterium Sec5.7]